MGLYDDIHLQCVHEQAIACAMGRKLVTMILKDISALKTSW